jgi:hypothetical protein
MEAKPKNCPVARLIDEHLLMIFVDCRDTHIARQQNVGVLAGLAYLVDSLPGSEDLEIDLRGQDSHFVVEQGKERDVLTLPGRTAWGTSLMLDGVLNGLGEDNRRNGR